MITMHATHGNIMIMTINMEVHTGIHTAQMITSKKNKQKVWVFGDSYFEGPIIHPKISTNSWTKYIDKNFDLANFAKGGSGLDWSLQQFLLHTHKQKTQNDILIFGLGSHYRFNLKFIDDPTFQGDYSLDRYRLIAENDRESKISTIKKVYKQFFSNSFLKEFVKEYILHSSYEITEFDKTVAYLYFKTKDKFKKVLLFPIFKLPKIEILNDKNFYIPDFCMANIEYNNTKGQWDSRANHMSNENNQLFANSIIRWITDNDCLSKNTFPTYTENALLN